MFKPTAPPTIIAATSSATTSITATSRRDAAAVDQVMLVHATISKLALTLLKTKANFLFAITISLHVSITTTTA
jgi:hypothetical protein